MKKILYLVRLPPLLTGAAKMNEMYLKSKLINKKFDVQFVKLNDYDSLEDMGKFNFKRVCKIFGKLKEVLFKLISFKPNLVYMECAPRGIAFLRDSLYIIMCKFFGKKIVIQFHAKIIDDEEMGLIKEKYYKFILRDTKVILLSPLLYPEVKRIFEKKNVYFLPNGITDELSEEEFEDIKKTSKPILLFLSHMYKWKGALDVLDICNKLNKDKIDFECLFVGGFYEDDFKKEWYDKLNEYELQDKCKYLGAKYGEDKKDIMKRANILILPTQYETFALVIIESFMYGIPVVSNDVGAIKEIISKDFLGYVSKNRDYNELYSYLKLNINKEFDSKRIRKHFKENYVFEKSEEKLLNIFEKEVKRG